MGWTWRNRSVGYDNIAAGSAFVGPENIRPGQVAPAQNPVDDLSVAGGVSPENLENIIDYAGNKAVSPSAAGTELP